MTAPAPSWGTPAAEHTVFAVYVDSGQRIAQTAIATTAADAEAQFWAIPDFAAERGNILIAGVAVVQDGRVRSVDSDPFLADRT